GGLAKKMPHTTLLFLIAALAICGLPPFNGFISEFLIYSGLFHAVHLNQLSLSMNMIVSICGLVIIGGLALLCFTKAFGIIFLGTERHPHPKPVQEAGFSKLFPKYAIALIIIIIGIVPQLFFGVIENPVGLFTAGMNPEANGKEFISTLQQISFSACGLIVLSALIFWIRSMVVASKNTSIAPTWGCGYAASTPKLQYTANSFVRSYRKLVKPMLMMNKKETEIKSVFPDPVHIVTQPYDRMEAILIDIPVKHLKGFLKRFRFLQNGNPQFYVLYGVLFIFFAIAIPLLIGIANYVIDLFKQI
ncbi:MAG TPA: proton-conducting transporter membrane subunit, partial [Chitinophagaceae bacterium]|nr:proton-conducting transporter membrane subunit [Chitinophagaceae bacterium]